MARRLYFQPFDRQYNAYREVLQAMFITWRAYPIAYNKWIREQVEEILGLPELHAPSHTCSKSGTLRAMNGPRKAVWLRGFCRSTPRRRRLEAGGARMVAAQMRSLPQRAMH